MAEKRQSPEGPDAGAAPGPNAGQAVEADVAESASKRLRIVSSEERFEAVAGNQSLRSREAALRETFMPNDPVHGTMFLPAIVQTVVDTRNFQRMRQIKQLGMCSLVWPGAVHDRFFHSIGTAFLGYELMKHLRMKNPELGINDRDVLCVTLAALCHDLGHPCYSHMFEDFVHGLGSEKRKAAVAAAQANGLSAIPAEEEALIQRYEKWNHEEASVMLLREMFKELRQPLEDAGLRVDAEGDDFACIEELIDPPKKALEELLERKQLRSGWSQLIKGRPVQKAWLYEVVSNWRSSIDVDKFDYFRRDALFLGIPGSAFDHHRYIKLLNVVQDTEGVPTMSPPEKSRESIREMLELRKKLHCVAYQHKTTKKLEQHMIDILRKMDQHVRVTGKDGRKLSMSEAAVELDPVGYPKLTDTFATSRLLDCEDPLLEAACNEYQQRILGRKLMRLAGAWDLPRVDEEAFFPLPTSEQVLSGVHALYPECANELEPEKAIREVPMEELRAKVAAFHYGMGAKDPISRVLFHSTKSHTPGVQLAGFDSEAKPLRHKIFVFWNPPADQPSDELTLKRLTIAFTKWAQQQVQGQAGGRQETPQVAPAAPAEPRRRPRRALRIQASCPPDMLLQRMP